LEGIQARQKTPEVDFNRNFMVFSRNIDFYNRISIFKITLKDGVIEILAMETRSALPIEDKVVMAIAVIPRAGVKFIRAGKERIPITPAAPFSYCFISHMSSLSSFFKQALFL